MIQTGKILPTEIAATNMDVSLAITTRRTLSLYCSEKETEPSPLTSIIRVDYYSTRACTRREIGAVKHKGLSGSQRGGHRGQHRNDNPVSGYRASPVVNKVEKKSDQLGVSYATGGLGGLLLQEADLPGARKMFEQSLAIRTSRGDKIMIAETQLALADLSLEEARSPAEQEAAVRQVLEVFQTQKMRDDETGAWCVLARALLAQGKAADAKEAMQHARSLSAKSQNPIIRWPTAITAARIETAEKILTHSAASSATRKELADIITKSRQLGYMGIELDARLALAEIEMKAGQITAGRAYLTAIESDAKAKGYNLIARKAATARG